MQRTRRPECLRALLWVLTLLGLGVLQGCASLYKPHNEPIRSISKATESGYRLDNIRDGDRGDHLVILTFSGGGTRAAALAYGVLQGVRDTEVMSRGRRVRLLDEVDLISSVSGGSFTSAYYGLFGDRIFTDYEEVFLRQSVQGALIGKLFDPVYWWKSLFSGFDRTEMAVEYYDSHIFEDKTYRDLQKGQGPLIEINATDLGGGNRFSFNEGYFGLICSDLDKFSVARAVTASSAVPLVFPPIVLENHAGLCNVNESRLYQNLVDKVGIDDRRSEFSQRMKSYLNRNARPYLHMVDGGLVDNLGLRALTERIEIWGLDPMLGKHPLKPKTVLVIAVNAEVKPERSIDKSASKPSTVETIDAFSDVQIALYNQETRLLVNRKMNEAVESLRSRGVDIDYYYAEVSFESVKTKTLKSLFNSLPTSLELTDQEVDLLIDVGRRGLSTSPGFKDFLVASEGRQVAPRPKAKTAPEP